MRKTPLARGSSQLKRSGFKPKARVWTKNDLKVAKRSKLPHVASTSSLEKKLDTLFSLYIRKRYATPDGMVRCVTCGKYDHWKETDAGHYISRQYLSTRYDERNVHVQCKSCNRFHEGRKDEYTLFLLKTYGVGILEELNRDKWKAVYNYPYEAQIILYTEKNHELR